MSLLSLPTMRSTTTTTDTQQEHYGSFLVVAATAPLAATTRAHRDGLGHLLTEWEVSCHLCVQEMASATSHLMSAHHSMQVCI